MGFITLIRNLALILIFFTTSCSQYLHYIEKKKSDEIELLPIKQTKHWCEKQSQINYIHNDKLTIEFFEKYKVQKENSIGDLAMVLSLYQMLSRPDATDWYSRTQLHIKKGDRYLSRDFGPLDQSPLYTALMTIAKEGFSQYSPNYWINHVNRNFPRKLKLHKELSQYLIENQETFAQNNLIKKTFFRLGKPLQYSESFLRKEIRKPKKQTSKPVTPILFPMGNSNNKGEPKLYCSFDSALYQKGIFLISNQKERENSFGLQLANGDYFFMVTKKILNLPSINTKDQSASNSDQIFPGKTSKSINPFCLYEENGKRTTLISLNSRDSGQILFHLFNYGVTKAKNPKEIFDFIKLPRHQFLLSPGRLLYESKRGTKKRLRYFLSLDFPVYHVESLGTVYGLWSKNQETSFITDPRKRIFQSCQN